MASRENQNQQLYEKWMHLSYITDRILKGCLFPFWGVNSIDKEWYIKEVLKYETTARGAVF